MKKSMSFLCERRRGRSVRARDYGTGPAAVPFSRPDPLAHRIRSFRRRSGRPVTRVTLRGRLQVVMSTTKIVTAAAYILNSQMAPGSRDPGQPVETTIGDAAWVV